VVWDDCFVAGYVVMLDDDNDGMGMMRRLFFVWQPISGGCAYHFGNQL
jgi:hypothetical protein